MNCDTLRHILLCHLRFCTITDLRSLWCACKDYYIDNNMIMGGSYLSTQTYIRVDLRIAGELIRFEIDLNNIETFWDALLRIKSCKKYDKYTRNCADDLYKRMESTKEKYSVKKEIETFLFALPYYK